MGLIDDLGAGEPPPGKPCSVQLALEEFPDEADDIWRVVMDSEISGAHIARVFTKYGLQTPPETINRHRRGECKCNVRMPGRYVNLG